MGIPIPPLSCLYPHSLPAAAAAAKLLQSCPTLRDPIDGSPLGSSVPGILQARTLEWVAISFSYAWKWKVKVKSLSHAQLLATAWTAAYQAPPSMGFSRQDSGVGCHCLFCTHSLVGVKHSSQQLPDNCAILKTFNIYKYISFYLKFCQDREFQLETYFPLRILKALPHCLLASGVIAKSEAFWFSILGLSAFFLTSLMAEVVKILHSVQELIPGSGRCSGERSGYPLQYSCLENLTNKGVWRATFHGVPKNQTRLGD